METALMQGITPVENWAYQSSRRVGIKSNKCQCQGLILRRGFGGMGK